MTSAGKDGGALGKSDNAHGAAEFYFYAVLMLVVAGAFIFLATRYRGRPVAGVG